VFDQTTRIVAVEPLRDYPLVVDVAIAKDLALAQWRKVTALVAPGTAVAATCLLLLLVALRRQFARLEASEERLDIALQSMDQGLVMVDAERRVAVCNRRAIEILGLPSPLMAAHPPLDAVLPYCDAIEIRDPPCAFTHERQLPNGLAVEFECVPLINGGGWVATCRDITARRRAEQQVLFMAHHDGLTRLPNRILFRERIEQAINQAGRSTAGAVLCLDLDHFKAVNDTLGHPVGDKLLVEVADRLSACVRQVDTVARFGGDEFAVVQVGPERVEDVAILAQRIIDVLSAPYDVDGHQVVVGASIGVSLVPADGSDPDTVLKHGDIALYRAKADGRGTFRFFKPEMDALLQERRTLEVDLRRALEANEFELFYQPQLDAQSRQVRGFEALIRWRHPTRGLLMPGSFMPLCEETGLIVPLGEWILREACHEAASWPDDVRVAVNLSAVQFSCRDLVRNVADALDASGLAAHRLDLEITETVLLENTEEVLAILHALRDLGTTISMDDFGTGYSSLSYLRRFPFDRIKIDQSFIRDLPNSADAAAIVRAIATLGSTLGIATTAEGVETQEQIRHLEEEGCGELQGFFFSTPVPAGEVPCLLQEFSIGTALVG
jgi:diguanylate cyclase (GGDEF)-like protein